MTSDEPLPPAEQDVRAPRLAMAGVVLVGLTLLAIVAGVLAAIVRL